jgi:voltage-gated potassium channel
MSSPLERVRNGAVMLGTTLVLAVIGYRMLGGYSWLDSLWMVVITISSVGYGEHSTLPAQAKLFTIGVIVVGMSSAAYMFGGLIQMMAEGEIERVLGRRRITLGIERQREHVIVCGYGRMGQIMAVELHKEKRPFVVIDQDFERVDEAKKMGYLCVFGDATADDVLTTAGVQRARTLVTALPSDAANVFITLTARNLNPEVEIIARAERGSSETKLRQAGANRVVTPTISGARLMVRMITSPLTADLMELVSQSSFLDMQLDELAVTSSSPLIAMSVRETEAHRRHRLLVVAVKQADGKMVFNPDAEYQFQAHDNIIVMGRVTDIQTFREQFKV